MQAIITHFKLDDKGDVVYVGKKPQFEKTIVPFPIHMGYGNYNKPKKIIGPYKINVDDIVCIEIAQEEKPSNTSETNIEGRTEDQVREDFDSNRGNH